MTTDEPTIKDQLASYIGVGESKPTEPEPALAIEPGERVAWTGNQVAHWPMALAVLFVLIGVFIFVAQRPDSIAVGGLVFALVGAAMLAFSRIHVLADGRGVRVRFGWLPWPSKFVAIADIAHAAAVDLRPTEWGGWGYRVARPAKGFSRSAVVLRKGEALHLTLRNGREFAVTIDGAAQAAAVVNAYAVPAAS